MPVTVVTTFSPKGYEVYGRKMIESFAKFWPEDIRFLVYHEGDKPKDAHSRAIWKSLDEDKDRALFLEEHEDHEKYPGDYRYRVVRYSHKVWAQTSAPRDGYLVWLDADTETKAQVTGATLAELLPPHGKIAAYLARPFYRHTETGFLSYSPDAGPFLDDMRRMYTSGDVTKLSEWHDCAVFDHVRKQYEKKGFAFHNLCPTARQLEVFEASPLAGIVQHNKGHKRKLNAYGNMMVLEL